MGAHDGHRRPCLNCDIHVPTVSESLHTQIAWTYDGGLIFSRLAFVTLKNNLMVLSLRAMIIQFLVLMVLAAFCFAGFFYALWTSVKAVWLLHNLTLTLLVNLK